MSFLCFTYLPSRKFLGCLSDMTLALVVSLMPDGNENEKINETEEGISLFMSSIFDVT